MSYNDKKFGNLFPTRQGMAIGGANERQMLDQAGGSAGYRKNFRVEPDGTTTMLTTKNGQPQFQTLIDGGGSDESKNGAGLASGAVFVKTNGETYYTRTTAVAAYATPGAKAKLVDRIDKTMVGTQPADKSATTAYVASDRNIIKRCPASLFTGKMRLYVQCLYGSLDALPATLALVDPGMTMPSLIYGGTPLDTSCGIYLEESTAKHYLISVTSGSAHELIRAPGVRWLEKKLLDPAIPSAEKAKVEAYLLAQSYPSSPQGMDLPPRIAGGMGYGWHFDWGGTAADCVGIESDVNPGDGQPCYKSTHYRITFSFVSGYITGTLVKISEGKWRNKVNFRNICAPIWDMSGFSKLGFKFLPEFGSGPLYAYYSHSTATYPGASTLQVCTWTANMGVVNERHGIALPDYMDVDTCMVCGTDEPSIETQNEYTSNVFTISAGGASASVFSANRGGSMVRAYGAVSDDVVLATHGWYKNDSPNGAFGLPPYMVANGRPSPIPGSRTPQGWYWLPSGPTRMVGEGGGTYDEEVVDSMNPSAYAYRSISPVNASWSREQYSKNSIMDGYLIGFPPYYDAEAYYVWGRQDQYDAESGDSYSSYGGGFRKFAASGGDGGPPTIGPTAYQDGYWSYLYGGGGTAVPFTREVWTYGTPTERLVCGATEHVPEAPLQYAHFLNSAYDVVGVFADAKSSTRGALYSTTFSLDISNAPLTFSGGWATYTGWA